MIYLDYAAHTPADRKVLKAFLDAETEYTANPNSTHTAGAKAKEKLLGTTNSIAKMLGVDAANIIYTSGATEANNLAVKGTAYAKSSLGKHILASELEHSSISETLSFLQSKGYEIQLIPTGAEGMVDLEQLTQLLRCDTILMCVPFVDSELGVVQPIEKIAEILKSFPNCNLHVDAAQSVGKAPLAFGIATTVSLAPHKFYGINGSGILIKKSHIDLEPQIHGGISTTAYRSGTPTLGLAMATEKALQLALVNYDARLNHVKELNAILRNSLCQYENVVINSPENAAPHVLNLSVTGVKGTVFAKALSEHGVCVSVKSACSSNGKPSKAVFAVSQSHKNALSSWRISLSHLTTFNEITNFLAIFEKCYNGFFA